jgi:hypothetical protein
LALHLTSMPIDRWPQTLPKNALKFRYVQPYEEDFRLGTGQEGEGKV